MNACLLTVLVALTFGRAQDYGTGENVVIYPLPDVSFRHVHRAVGTSVTLNCYAYEKHKHKHGFMWQKCSSMDHHWPICSQWTALCKNCSPYHHMNNITHRESGVYRCKHGSTPIVLFHLEIKEPERPPEIPEVSPSNLTVFEGMPVALHCRVHSEQYIDLRWLLHSSATWNDTENIVYLGVHYKPLTSQGQVRQGTMYYSQLNLKRTSVLDSGCYMCVALNQKWSTARDVQLTVLPNSLAADLTQGYEDNSWSLNLLFLIPAALALLPVTVWLCCQWRRRFNKQKLPILIQHTKYHPGEKNTLIHIR